MKRLFTLSTLVAMVALSVATAEAGNGKRKPQGFANQSSVQQSESSGKFQPTQSSAWQGQSSQTQSYQATWNASPSQTKLQPSTPVRPTDMSRVPKFGFDSTFGQHNECLGEQVTRVEFGGPASRLGLEPGDAIVGVNGRDLQTATCWHNAIQRAADQDGWVTLKIVDGRSGRMAYRTANLFQLNAR